MKKVLMSLMAIGLAVALMGGGAFGFFTDTEESSGNTFTAGTLDMQLNDDAPNEWGDGATATWQSPDHWLPGEEVTTTLRIKNIGSVHADYFYVDLGNLTVDGGIDNVQSEPELAVNGQNINNLASHIFVKWFEIKVDEWTIGNWASMISNWGPFKADQAGPPLTLNELVDDIYGPMLEGTGVLAANEGNQIQVVMTLQFDPNAGNEYQGDKCSFDLAAIAATGTPAYFYKAGETSTPAYGYGYQ